MLAFGLVKVTKYAIKCPQSKIYQEEENMIAMPILDCLKTKIKHRQYYKQSFTALNAVLRSYLRKVAIT